MFKTGEKNGTENAKYNTDIQNIVEYNDAVEY